jgi:superfamily I DNA and/or RNA helicase
MKKWVGVILSLLLFVVWLFIYSPFNPFKRVITKKEKGEQPRIVFVQNEKEEKRGETDPHFLLILKKLQEKLDEWLKSLNERIESEDITRFEVRFLEILRNILEWIKEKIDAKIESSETEKPPKKQRGIFREIHQKVSPFSSIG